MTRSSPYQTDIFISYAHRDNQPHSGIGWVTNLHTLLKQRVGELLGEDVNIWRDQSLCGNDELNDEIIARIRESKAFLSILSPSYINSEWCKKELREFCDFIQNDVYCRAKNKSRVFKVEKLPVDRTNVPSQLQNLKGYRLYDEYAEGRCIEYPLTKNFTRVVMKINDLAWEINQLIKSFNSTTKKSISSERLKTVYLAKTTSDVEEQRNIVKRHLLDFGFTVLPDQSIQSCSWDINKREHIQQALKHATCSIHLVGEKYGPIPEDEQQSIVEIQYYLAKAHHSSHPFPMFIWAPPSARSEDKRQQSFMKLLIFEENTDSSYFFIQKNIEEFKLVIQNELERVQIDKNTIKSKKEFYTVFLYYALKDMENVQELRDFLISLKNIETIEPPIKDRKKDVYNFCLSTIRNSDVVINYFNQANESWLEFQKVILKRALQERQGKTKSDKLFFITGKKTFFKERFQSNLAQVIRHFSPFSTEPLEPILSNLK